MPWRFLVQRGFLVLMSFLLLGVGCAEQGPEAKSLPPPKVELGSTFCLTTQWYPEDPQEEDETENRLLREIVRQGVLMVAREELGLVTRDETLGEPFSELTANSDDEGQAKEFEPLSILLMVDKSGTWDAKLFGAGTSSRNPAWSHRGEFDFDKRTLYAQFATEMTQLGEGILKQLRRAGAEGVAAKFNPENMPTEEIEKQLSEMNFVSQFAAIRVAHQAIQEKGASLEWLGVLVRGYAHLAVLTEHTWCSHTEVFAARALLYAERMLQLSNASALSKWHRAYARSIIGLHALALEDVEDLSKQPVADEEAEMPAWTAVIVPYAQYDHGKLEQLQVEDSKLAETIAFLQWHLYRSYQHGRWIYEKGLEAMDAVPEAYGVYSVMANWSALRIERIGSSRGARAFGEQLPKRVATLADLPEATRAITTAGQGLFSKWFGSSRQATLSEQPMKIARSLTAITNEKEPVVECSWSILANLIAEEQFVEAANMISVAGDAVEYSKVELVQQLSPLVEGHRYAAYIKSCAVSPGEAQKSAEILKDMLIVDPRGNMKSMYTKLWQVPLADGRNGCELSWWSIWSRNHTQAGLTDVVYGVVGYWPRDLETSHYLKFANEAREISPHSSTGIRLEHQYVKNYNASKLAAWETELKEDPIAWMTLGERYFNLSEFEKSERCYQRSLDISPCFAATKGLANTYYHHDKKDFWESTLKSYLEVEDLGLAHGQIHQQLAVEYMHNRDWKKAEPHALAAAETYSAWGLNLAGRMYEGMQEWEKSEYFIAESARNYPSYDSGTGWYYWCRRTGRGNLDEARSYAERSINIAAQRPYYDGMLRTYTYHLLEGNPAAALDSFDDQLSNCKNSEKTGDRAYRLLHEIIACSQLKNDERKQHALLELSELVEEHYRQSKPERALVYEGLIKTFSDEELPADFFAKFEKFVLESTASDRCNFCYFLGAALDLQGQTEQAEQYLRRSAFAVPFDRYNGTLAGHLLAQRHGSDRGGLPEEFAELEAKVAAEQKAEPKDDDNSDSSI